MTKQIRTPRTANTRRFDACLWRDLVGPGYQFSTLTERTFERPLSRPDR